MDALVDEQLRVLRQKGIGELMELPKCTEVVTELDGRKVEIFTIHDEKDDEHLIVVQATRKRWGGMTAAVSAQGFKIGVNREIKSLTREELYDFT